MSDPSLVSVEPGPLSVSVEPGPLSVSVVPDNDELSADNDDAEFFLRSLADIEREHAAGDLDDDDYQRLRDAYTVRAAAALRHTPVATGAARPSKRGWAVGTGVLAVAVIAGVLLARGSGERLPGQTITGDIPALAQRPVIVPKGCPADLERPKPPKAVPVNPRQAEIDKLRKELADLRSCQSGRLSGLPATAAKPKPHRAKPTTKAKPAAAAKEKLGAVSVG